MPSPALTAPATPAPPEPRATPALPKATPLLPVSVPQTPMPTPEAWPEGVSLFTRDGRPAGLSDLVAASRLADVVFVGEYHDDPGAHAVERALQAALSTGAGGAAGRPLALSLEMFETDVQPVLDEYLAGLVREKDFLAAARPWNNYSSDYRPLLEWARQNRQAVVAANAPHRYVIRVGRHGPDGLAALSAPARAWLPALPWPEPSVAYADRFAAFAREALGGAPASLVAPPLSATSSSSGNHGTSQTAQRMFEAQWLRDVTMAHSIARHLEGAPGALVLHVTGLFHSQSAQGTVEALRHYRPGVRAMTLAVVRRAGSAEFLARDMRDLGDFVAVSRLAPVRPRP